MYSDRQRRIEQRAYALWEAEGYPHGNHKDHWLRAVREIEEEETAGELASRTSRRTTRRGSENSGTRSPSRRKKAIA